MAGAVVIYLSLILRYKAHVGNSKQSNATKIDRQSLHQKTHSGMVTTLNISIPSRSPAGRGGPHLVTYHHLMVAPQSDVSFTLPLVAYSDHPSVLHP